MAIVEGGEVGGARKKIKIDPKTFRTIAEMQEDEKNYSVRKIEAVNVADKKRSCSRG